jgi:predicted ATPase
MQPLHEWLVPQPSGSTGAAGLVGSLFPPVLELITRLADEDAVAIAFEDLHWADATTWDLFDYLARNLIDERVVMVGTYRANEVGAHPAQRRRLAEASRLPLVHPVHLSGLDRADVTARVEALMDGEASADLVQRVLVRGQGNPFFTEELVAAHMAGEAIPAVLSDLILADLA